MRALLGCLLPLRQRESPQWQDGRAPDITLKPEASSLLPQWKGSVASGVELRLEHGVCRSSALLPLPPDTVGHLGGRFTC